MLPTQPPFTLFVQALQAFRAVWIPSATVVFSLWEERRLEEREQQNVFYSSSKASSFKSVGISTRVTVSSWIIPLVNSKISVLDVEHCFWSRVYWEFWWNPWHFNTGYIFWTLATIFIQIFACLINFISFLSLDYKLFLFEGFLLEILMQQEIMSGFKSSHPPQKKRTEI